MKILIYNFFIILVFEKLFLFSFFVLKISPSIILTLKLSFESLIPNIFDKVDLPVPDNPVNHRIFVFGRESLNVFSDSYIYIG